MPCPSRTALAVATVLTLLGSTGVASAQAPVGPPAQTSQPASNVQALPTLSEDEQRLLREGEISEGRYRAGVGTSILLGFGVGQAIHGRWRKTGWIFTFGEAASVLAIHLGWNGYGSECGGPVEPSSADCSDSVRRAQALLIVGVLGMVAFRVAGVAEAVTAPRRHNQRVREIRNKLGQASTFYTPYLAPVRGGGGIAGVSVAF
jgi:hypothetical protein